MSPLHTHLGGRGNRIQITKWLCENGATEWLVLPVAEEGPKDAALSLSPGWSPYAPPPRLLPPPGWGCFV